MKFGHRVLVTPLFAPTAVTESGSLIQPMQPEAGKELGNWTHPGWHCKYYADWPCLCPAHTGKRATRH